MGQTEGGPRTDDAATEMGAVRAVAENFQNAE